MHFLAQPTLGADTKAVADDQHANQQGWIDRRATGVAVVRREVLMQFAQIQEPVDATEQMVRWNVIFQIEGIEQWCLPGTLTSHHRVDFPSIDRTLVDQVQMADSTEFFNGIGQEQTVAIM